MRLAECFGAIKSHHAELSSKLPKRKDYQPLTSACTHGLDAVIEHVPHLWGK